MERLFRVHTISSGCGQGGPSYAAKAKDKLETSPPSVQAGVIIGCVTELLRTSELHKKMGGVHSAALYSTDGKRIVFFNEIGRHNAVDKLIGYAVRNSLPLGEAMLLSTGRLSSEILSKAVAAKIPVVISKASPTSLSVELASQSGIVMIGNVRGRKFRVYNGREHVQE
jgi:FdhD protein